jgi:phosphoglycolate phosphatase
MVKRTRQKMAVFDLDGTLIDTAPDLIYSANEVIKDIINIDIDYEKSKKFIGRGGEYFINRNLIHSNIKLPQNKIDELIKEFLVIYENNISNRSKLYPGVTKLLSELHQRNFILNICTNKPEKLAKLVLKDFELIQYFDEIIGGDTLSQCKPNPLPLLKLMNDYNIKPSDTIMIGDTTTDILTAKNCNIKSICVDFGYFNEKIEGVDPDYWVSNYNQVINIINEIF